MSPVVQSKQTSSPLPSATTTTPTPTPASTKPIVLSGPSGTGKSTLLSLLFARHPTTFGFSISHTTRAPRPGEVDGREYHFVAAAEFSSLMAKQAFLEHAVFSSNRYGTSIQAVRDVEAQGKICILDIEMEGVKQVTARGLGARVCFVAPPSLDVLEARLRGRGTESEDAVRRRLERARQEIEWVRSEQGRAVVELVLVNDQLERAYAELERWIFGGRGGGQEGG